MRDLNELSSNLFYTSDVSMPEPVEVEDVLSGDVTLVSLDYNIMEYYIDVKVSCEHPLKKSLYEGLVGYNIPMTISLPENWTHEDSEYSIDFSIRGASKDKIVKTASLPYKVNSGKLQVVFDLELIRKFSNPEIQLEITQTWDNKKILFSFDFSSMKMEPEGASSPEEATSWNQVTVSNIKNNYLFGIDLSDANGNPLPPDLFVHYINASVDYLQNLLDIVITPTEFTERHDYVRSDYMNWGFIQLDHNPVRTVKRLSLMYGNERSVDIPSDWIQLDKLTGQITLFPAAGSANSLIIGQTGTLFGFQGSWNYAPMMWEVEYEAGIDENDKTVPVSLLKEAVSKRASCGILNVWGDLIIGAGIANQSVSIDGISQSIGTTQSAMFGGASARVTEYTKDLNENILPVLRQKFGGIRMVVV